MKAIFKNGNVIDGTGSEGRITDTMADERRIVEVGQIEVGINEQVVDTTGEIIRPGFINTHVYSDPSAIINPTLSTKVRQGITAELLDQDDVALTPLPEEYIPAWRKNIAGLDGDTDKIDWRYENTDSYLNLLTSRHPTTNPAYLVPYGSVRMKTMDLDERPSIREDVAKMCEVPERELRAGAFGLSTGLIYVPCAFGDTAEMIELCKVTVKYGGIFVVHQRNEADDIINSTQELIDIAKTTGVWLHISYMKVYGKKDRELIDQMLDILEQTQEERVRISFDQCPYVVGSAMLGVILPLWIHSGGTDKLLERLASSELRTKMIDDIQQGIPGWNNSIDFVGLDQISVTSMKTAKNQDAAGLSLVQLDELHRKNPYNTTFDLLFKEENAVRVVDFYGTEEHVIELLCRPEQNVCTGGLMGADRPHPRVFGAFPRVPGKYVREKGCLSWEAAVCKMTGKPVEVSSLQDRGLLKVGYAADIMMFDLNTIADKGTFVESNQCPEGIGIVMVSERIALINDTESYACSNAVIRRQY